MHPASLDSSDLDPTEPEIDGVEPILASVAHDFGNILAVITNYVSLASRRVDDPTTAELLEKVQGAAGRAARLNRRLYDLAACGTLAVQPVLVNDLIREAQPTLVEGLRDGCGLQVELAAEPLAVLASPTGIEMALRHLLDNACDAMADGGVVTLATRRPGDTGGRAIVEITVSDTGVGMPSEVLDRALEPAFSTYPKGHKSGLGLTIVDRVLRRLGGEVRVESTQGSGTTVHLRLAEAMPGG